MTCIIGYIDSNGVGHMAADSSGTSMVSHTRAEYTSPKIFKNGKLLFGFTSSFRMGQILEYGFTQPDHPNGMTDMAYMVTKVAPAIREALSEGKYILKDEKYGGTFLVIYNGNLYKIQEDFSVLNPVDPVDGVGSGGTYAVAVFKTIMEFGLMRDIGIKEALMKSVELTSREIISVSGRVDYLNTNGDSDSRDELRR